MSLFKKLPFDAEVHIREKALNHCRAMFVKDLDLQQVIEYMALDDNCLQDNLGLGQSTKEEQIVRFLNYLNTRNEKSFSLFMDFLNENQKHLFTLMEETIRSFGNCYSVHGNQDEMQMTGERLQHLLKKREKNPIHKAPTDQLVGSEDSKINPFELDECYISCHSTTARVHHDKEKWIMRVTEQTDVEKDKTLSMSVVISDSVFRKINLSDAKIPDLVRRPPKQCEVYVYDDEQGRNAVKKAVDLTAAHRTKHDDTVSSGNFINNQHNETKKYTGSCGTVQIPPPVPPKPRHLPLIGFDVGISFAQKTSGSEMRFLAGNLKKQEIVKNSSSDLLAHTVLPTVSVPINKKTEKLPSALKEARAESLTLTGYHRLHDREIDMPRGNASETVQRQSQDSDELMMNDECSLDYNVSLHSVSDLGFEEKNVVGEDKKKIWKTDKASESFSAEVENRAMPTYSSVDLERKNSRFRGTADGERQSPRIEVFVNDVDEIVGNKVDEVAKIPEKSLVDLLPGETFPAPETVELCTMATETEHHLKMRDMADPPLPAKQISLCELPGDEDDTSSDNSYYEDIDVLSQTASVLSKGATNGEIYLDPKMKERTSGKWRGLILSDYRSNAPPYKIIPKGYLVLVENVSSCQELSHTKSGQSSDDGSHTSPIESCIKISCSDETSASQSNKDEETEVARETTSKPGLVISQRPDILCETSITNSQDILHYFYNTRLAYDKDGYAFYVPIHLLKKFGDPDGEPWFYPLSMTARQAALFLMAEKLEGCFVVYQPLSQSPDVTHNLSVCLESGDVVHYHIIENALGDIRIEGHDRSFMTLTELIDYFSKNKSSLATRLRRPLKYAHLSITPGFHYDISYELERTELSLTGNIIGQGYFGVVCSGMYRNLPVAIKVLQQTDGMLSNEDDFLEEAKSLMGLRHEHVVRLVGVSCKARPFFIVTEFASNGSVKDCLRNGKLRSDHVEELFKLCVQVISIY